MDATEISKLALKLLLSGKVKNHSMLDTAPRHSGENEDVERKEYKRFIMSKNCYMILDDNKN